MTTCYPSRKYHYGNCLNWHGMVYHHTAVQGSRHVSNTFHPVVVVIVVVVVVVVIVVVVVVIVIKVRLHHHCPSDANIDCYVRHLSCHNPPPLPKPPCLSSALVFVLVAASLLLLSLSSSSLTYARQKYAEVHRTGVFGFWDVFRPQKFRRHVRPPRLNFCLFRK